MVGAPVGSLGTPGGQAESWASPSQLPSLFKVTGRTHRGQQTCKHVVAGFLGSPDTPQHLTVSPASTASQQRSPGPRGSPGWARDDRPHSEPLMNAVWRCGCAKGLARDAMRGRRCHPLLRSAEVPVRAGWRGARVPRKSGPPNIAKSLYTDQAGLARVSMMQLISCYSGLLTTGLGS